MTWKQFVRQLVVQFCESQGGRTFKLGELTVFAQEAMAGFAPGNNHREEKLRQTLQFLRDDGFISFVDGRGTYTLRGMALLADEVEADAVPLIKGFQGAPAKREYLVEVYARHRGWVRLARETYGLYCLWEGCTNSFLKTDGTPYCEVHHIVPLCEGGEEGIWNLSVLCAHHHRLAHFASEPERTELKSFLWAKTERILTFKSHLTSGRCSTDCPP
jgi:5-methylcytosine-specific restriction endonuclease McrA